MKKVGIVYDDIFTQHSTQGRYSHPECKERIIETKNRLKAHSMYGKDCSDNFVPITPRFAKIDEIEWAHSNELINQINYSVKRTNQYIRVYLDGDTPVSPESMNAALMAAGGNFQAIDSIMTDEINRAFVLCRPPGHHANRGYARGFCLFNNVVLATNYLMKKKGIKRVAIVDFDVHAGNGSEDLLWNGLPDGEVLFISSHQDPSSFYPFECFADDIGQGKQKGKIINIPMIRDSGDESMKLILNKIINPVLTEFKPEFILFSAGFDAHHADPIGGLSFTEQLYGKIIQSIEPIANEYAKGRMLATLEGGYNIGAMSRSIVNVIQSMSNGKILEDDDEYTEDHSEIEYTENKLIPRVHSILEKYWKCFKDTSVEQKELEMSL